MGPYEIQKILARLAQYLLHWWKALGFFFPPIKWSPGFDGRCLQQSLSYSKILNRWKWMGKEWYVCFYSPSFSKPFFGVTSTSTLIRCYLFETTVSQLWKCLSLSWLIILYFSLSRWANSYVLLQNKISWWYMVQTILKVTFWKSFHCNGFPSWNFRGLTFLSDNIFWCAWNDSIIWWACNWLSSNSTNSNNPLCWDSSTSSCCFIVWRSLPHIQGVMLTPPCKPTGKGWILWMTSMWNCAPTLHGVPSYPSCADFCLPPFPCSECYTLPYLCAPQSHWC